MTQDKDAAIRYPVGKVDGTADDCLSPVTRKLVAYWNGKRPAAGGLPKRSDIELMDLYDIASHLVVKDVVGNGEAFINRFWGTDVTEALGFDGTGMSVSDYRPATMRDAVTKRYRHIVETGRSSMARGNLSTMPGKEHIPFELVHLPLAGRTDRVEHIISAYHFGFVADRKP